MFKLIALLLGLAVGFGGGVYWAHQHPDQAATLSAAEEKEFLQAQLGYTATIAGLSLSAGGLVLLFMMPLAGQAVSRLPARNIIVFGFCCFAASYYFTAVRINLGLSFGMASFLRVVQVAAIPFVFISFFIV